MLIYNETFLGWAGDKFDFYRAVLIDIQNELNVENCPIEICLLSEEMKKQFPSLTTSPASMMARNDDTYAIMINPETEKVTAFEFGFLMAHEMRHVWQYHHKIRPVGEISFGYRRFPIWKDKIYLMSCGTIEDYAKLPWEFDANLFAYEYCLSKNWKFTWPNVSILSILVGIVSRSDAKEDTVKSSLRRNCSVGVIRTVIKVYNNSGLNLTMENVS